MTLSLKTRQVAGVTLIVGLAVVAMSAIHLASIARFSLEESALRGELLARTVFEQAAKAAAAEEPYPALQADPGIRSILQSGLAYAPDVTYVAITDTASVAVAHSSPVLEGQLLPAQPPLRALLEEGPVAQLRAIYSDRTFEVRERLLMGTSEFGSIRVGLSMLLVREEIGRAVQPALATLAMALAVALGLATLLSNWILRPIAVLRSGLSRLGQGDVDVTLDLPPDAEFVDLGRSFESVSAELAAMRERADGGTRALEYSQRTAALGRLLAGVAHEVKNPLNAMTIHLELLREKLLAQASDSSARADGAPERARDAAPAGSVLGLSGPADALEPPPEMAGVLHHAGVIAHEIQRLDEVVQGFLKFTRPEDLSLDPVSVRGLVDDVCRVIAPEAAGRGVALHNECPDDLAPVRADRAMLHQAVLNLGLNACQAMPDGGRLRFRARLVRPSGVELSVEDTGVGIAPADLGKIFNLYFTTKEGGSGIGLSMVYRTVQLHNGTIEVESTMGRGTTFRLVLPRA